MKNGFQGGQTMNKTDRLLAIVLELQRKEVVRTDHRRP